MKNRSIWGILLISVLYLQNLTTAKELSEDAVSAAILKAKATLYGKGRQGLMNGNGRIDMGDHSYVKLNELTEMIGTQSNINLLAYEDLIKQGYPKSQALASLIDKRPDVCTFAPSSCDPLYPYRSINGTCNNLQNPLWGSILQPFVRLTRNGYLGGFNEPRGGRVSTLPNARLVSSTIHPDLDLPDPSITNMVPQFGQFVDHDMTLTPEGDKHCCTESDIDCWSISVSENDPFYSAVNRQQTCLPFTRSTPYCFPTTTENAVREQFNILTAFVDASQVYGSDHEREFQLREHSKGRMRVSRNNPNLLPTVAEVEEATCQNITFMGKFLAGDERVNEMPALATMHTLMVREHNRIAAQILALKPTWTDEEIYQETRRLVIAEWQNIVYGEYLPVILGPTAMNKYFIALPTNTAGYTTYDSSVNPTIFHSFATAAYRFGHTLINGLVRLMRGLDQVGSYRVKDNFFVDTQLTQETPDGFGYDLILGGLVTQNAQTYDECVTEDLTNFLLRDAKSMDDFGSDLVARNLQRGRDHGLQSYNAYRQLCDLPLLSTWSANPPKEINPKVWAKLPALYDSPTDIDLFTGGLSEIPVADGVSGPTFNCLKSTQFQFALDGDRFFFTHSNQPRPFTPAQLQQLRARRLSDIICENSAIQEIPRNVFRTAITHNGVPNPRMSCSDPSRAQLNIANFV